MKKQVTSLALIALLGFTTQSCKKEADKSEDMELTPGQKLDTMIDTMKAEKDTAAMKIDTTMADIKNATKKGVNAVEGAAKDVKKEVEKTADGISKEMKK